VRFCVTTGEDPRADERASAREAAQRHRVPFVERARGGLAATVLAARVEAALVLGREHASAFLEGELYRYSAGMGELRRRRLERGEGCSRDLFLEAAGLRPGDRVLDATLGLGMDALVAAEAVGEGGAILGVERSPLLAALVAEGLARHPVRAARRVRVVAADAAALLADLPEASFDVVVFDPMFRSPLPAGRLFELVRRLGDGRPLEAETVFRARRVARRSVVVKAAAPDRSLEALGLELLPGSRWQARRFGRAAGLASSRKAGL